MNNQNDQNRKPGQQQDQQGQQRLNEQQQQRQGGSAHLGQIKEHMEVVGSDGAPVGTVDKIEGNRIKLTKSGNGGGHGDHHHYIDASSIASVEGNKVCLSTKGGGAGMQEKGGEQVNKRS